MADLKEMIAELLINICRKLSDGNLRRDVLDHVCYTIEREEHILTLCSQIMYIDGRIFLLLSEAKLLIWHEDQLQENSDINYQSSSSHDGNRGRPRYLITRLQLEYFIQFGFKVPEMASMLGVSKSTLQRRLK